MVTTRNYNNPRTLYVLFVIYRVSLLGFIVNNLDLLHEAIINTNIDKHKI